MGLKPFVGWWGGHGHHPTPCVARNDGCYRKTAALIQKSGRAQVSIAHIADLSGFL